MSANSLKSFLFILLFILVGGLLYLASLAGKFDQDFKKLPLAQRIQPTNILITFAKKNIKKKDYQKAEKLLQFGLKFSKQKEKVIYHLGTVYLEQGRPSQALEFADKAIAIKPDYVDPYLLKAGISFFIRKDPVEALRILSDISQKDPNNIDLLNFRAYISAARGDLEKARELNGLAYEKNGSDTRTMSTKAYVHMLAKEYEDALMLAEDTLIIEGDNPLAILVKARVFLQEGDHESCIELLLPNLKKGMDVHQGEASEVLTQAYIRGRRFEEALPFLQEAIKLNPGNAEALANLIWAYRLQGDYEKALKAANKGMSSGGNADLAFMIEDLKRSQLYLVQKIGPKGPGARLEAVQSFERGFFIELNESVEKANQYYREAIEKDPTLWAPYHRLAKYEFQQYNLDQAEKLASKALSLSPPSPTLSITMANIFLAKGRLQEAKKILEPTIRYYQKDHEPFLLLGLIHYLDNEFAPARNYLIKAQKLNSKVYFTAYLLGIIFGVEKNSGKSTENIEYAKSLAPHMVDTIFLESIFQAQGQNTALMEKSLEKAAELSPNSLRLLISYTYLYALKKDEAQTTRYLASAQSRGGSSSAAMKYLQLYENAGEQVPDFPGLNLEKDQISEVLSNFNLTDPSTRKVLAILNERVGNFSAAESNWSFAYKTDPTSPSFILGLANIKLLLGKFNEINPLLAKVLENDPNSGKANYLGFMSNCLNLKAQLANGHYSILKKGNDNHLNFIPENLKKRCTF